MAPINTSSVTGFSKKVLTRVVQPRRGARAGVAGHRQSELRARIRGEKVESGRARQVLAEDEARGAARPVLAGELLGRTIILNRHAIGLEEELKRVPHGFIIIDDEEPR